MLYAERNLPQSTSNTVSNNSRSHNKYDYISDKFTSLKNNSTSSSISSNSSSSATNSSLNGAVCNATYIEPKYPMNYQTKPANNGMATLTKQSLKNITNPVYNLPRFSYLTLSPSLKKNQQRRTSNDFDLDDHSSQFKKVDLFTPKHNKKHDSTPSSGKFEHQRQSLIQISNLANSKHENNNNSKTTNLSDRLLAAQAKMNTVKSQHNSGTQIRTHKPKPSHHSSSSYTYHTYNPNRLSSYDNDIYEYNNININNINNSTTTNNNNTINNGIQKQDDLEMIFRKSNLSGSTNQRASIALPTNGSSSSNNNNSSSKHQSNIHLLKSCVKTANSNNNTNNSSNHQSVNKTSSSNNLFARAFNYAFKKTSSSSNANNSRHHQSVSNSLDANKSSWKAKIGKYFPQTVNSSSSQSQRKLNKEEGCDIVLDDDLYESATYHLSRRHPITSSCTNNNNSNSNNSNNNSNSSSNKKHSLNSNNDHLMSSTCSPLNSHDLNTNLMCLTTAHNSSSGFSSFDNTPYSTSAQISSNGQINSSKKSSSSKRARAKCLEKTSSSSTNLNRSSPGLFNGKNASPLLPQSLNQPSVPPPSVSQHPHHHHHHHNQNNNHHHSSKSLINNGFNSLRKILKISSNSNGNSNGSKSQHHSKHSQKCSSASTTPVPPISTKLINSNFDKLKETKIVNPMLHNSPIIPIRSSLSSSNASLIPPNTNRQHQINMSTTVTTDANSKTASLSKHVIKPIGNQISSTFSSSYSASLASSSLSNNDTSSSRSKINILDNNTSQQEPIPAKKQVLFDKNPEEIIPSKLSSFTSIKLEEDKNKALKLLDFYKNSLNMNSLKEHHAKQSDSKNSKQNEVNRLKISSAEIYLTKNILIDDQDHQLKHASYSDSDYYEISKKTNENENENSTKNEDQISAGSRTSTAGALATATITSITTSSGTSSSSSKKTKDISSEEEILCDLEVASYFDDRKLKNSDDESNYYYEKENNPYETNNNYKSKSISHNDDCYPDEFYPVDVAAEEDDDEDLMDDDDDPMNDILDDVIDDELDELRDDDDDDDENNLDEDSSNLEYLVRQLAAEATLSLNGKKIVNTYKKSNYDNSINKKLEKDYPNTCVLKNKIFSCSSNENQKFINTTVSDEEEELVYDLESNFGLNDYINDCHDEKQFSKKDLSSKSELDDYNENRFNDEDYDYDYNGSYSKSDTSESLNGLKMSNLNFSVINTETSQNINNINKYNSNGFSSLRNNSNNKPKPNVFTLSHRLNNLNNQQLKSNLYEQKKLEKELFGDNRQKRSSSTSSTGQQSHVVKLIDNKKNQSTQHYQQQLPQHNYQQHQAKHNTIQLARKENEFNNIKIEKKIRLNYNRPQNFNSILNFGTLC